jgi:alpha-tubulin suppressor-like RCC1 family protein
MLDLPIHEYIIRLSCMLQTYVYIAHTSVLCMHCLQVWGGNGVGPVGMAVNPEDSDEADLHLEPRPVKELTGEEIVRVSVGSSHAVALSKGGDVYVWGRGDAGQLGLGGYTACDTPVLLNGLHEGAAACQVYT